ncbi:FAD-dependent oxidoreductase [Janthinobacterium sp. SUN100]|uniref:NAD(P)/FAD-dependent oxidoreductase n=1 Tax=Janthinobacterium sp. SUN100 TaxID=3004101 RepID=UPI0025B1588C|nr:FAD-dependent oxidoreductase [Janthinobacterium sp. SUN100]MDN2705749.1 FAD-dependent oxidoreductase [Janthinobacterium sp. SUN100]
MTQRVLIIGAGFAGLWSALAAVRRLRLENVAAGDIEVALVAPEAVLTMRPRLYEPAPAGMVAPLQQLFDDTGVRFIAGKVEAIRSASDEVDIVAADGSRSTLAYDRLVLAAGSSLFRPDIPGLQEFAFSTDQRDDAVALDAHLHGLAARPASAARNTVIVAGGGFTGIELAAELPARLRAILGEDADIKVIIVERAPDIGPDLGPGPRPVIEQALAELGVECRLGSAVAAIDGDGLTTADGERIEAATVVWTAGVRASALTAQIPGDKDAAGRLRVANDLRVPGAGKVFATGDAAVAATDDAGNHTLMSCQHAMFLGRSSGDNAVADLLGLATRPYRQPYYVTCLDLGAWGAVVTQGWERKVWMTGSEGKALKVAINGRVIYPPADSAAALAAADPAFELSL